MTVPFLADFQGQLNHVADVVGSVRKLAKQGHGMVWHKPLEAGPALPCPALVFLDRQNHTEYSMA